ncbi:DEAD/DEAH box helicase [Endozoicomonas gorgoniicola]|uniref:DEAD/DEAH box helicase n=1 Tax=Endozoicomonas gorgoniicola TaxID=1234144 RepID=A0ABT3MTM5_9GAMM|nr:DEAD/DEAH box helicase [Endozoicomonas gorgoniicola]MCW7552725.1 DEAD/DEAH box helicase [Endozoicomonas gorgoniicola]
MSDIFEDLHNINDFINANEIDFARNEVIKLLAKIEKQNLEFPELLNHFIRSVGLYPYLDLEKASWQEKFIHESFKVNTGENDVTLHKEQSSLLKKLLKGENIAVSAPTSFGKSFVIDSFIAINKPKNVVIIVPTIALTDETRRRLQRKFSNKYKIITTTDVEPSNNNIFIFPQERAISYIGILEEIDILIIDEFYKASKKYDKERSPSLLRAILKLSKIAKQRYFLAPNIKHLNGSVFTEGMEFISLNYNTVFLEKNEVYKQISDDVYTKSDALIDILKKEQGKTLIYAGTYSSINEVSNLLIDETPQTESQLLIGFSHWLIKNYDRNWQLTSLIKRGCGVHNGRLHRSLSQIQVKLFEEQNGLNRLLSTSSIIEGVNTSAENVILWRNKNGTYNLNDFTYRNIIGRGGRMFKHFIGNIFLLEEPPKKEENQIDLEFSDELAASIDEKQFSQELTQEQIAKIIAYKEEMSEILGEESFDRLQKEHAFDDADTSVILRISRALDESPNNFKGLGYLNSSDPEQWEYSLFKVLEVIPGYIGAPYRQFVEFIKVISQNWSMNFHQLLNRLDQHNIGIDDFFELERKATFKFASLLNEINVIQHELYPERSIDISSFASKVSYAFLPPNVYILEEYGLPRMISKKIHDSGLINLEDDEISIHDVLDSFNELGYDQVILRATDLDYFDKYILEHFYEGIYKPEQS